MNEVVIYSRPYCGYCELAKALLEAKGVPFSEIDLTREPERLREMVDGTGGSMAVPQIFVAGRHVGGFNELAMLERRGQLDRMLTA